MNRRDFLKNSGIIAAAATLSPVMTACGNEASDLARNEGIFPTLTKRFCS